MKHRCKNCNKQLAQGRFSGCINIKCPRCNRYSYMRDMYMRLRTQQVGCVIGNKLNHNHKMNRWQHLNLPL